MNKLEDYFRLANKIKKATEACEDKSRTVAEHEALLPVLAWAQEDMKDYINDLLNDWRAFVRSHEALYVGYKIKYLRFESIEYKPKKNALVISGKESWGEGDFSETKTHLIPILYLENEAEFVKSRTQYVHGVNIRKQQEEVVALKKRLVSLQKKIVRKENALLIALKEK